MRPFVCGNRCCRSAAPIVLAILLGSTAAIAAPKPFSIEAEEAPRSLLEFGRQSAVQILFASAEVKGIITNAVRGNYEPITALNLLLKGTSLVVKEKPDGVLVVEPQARGRKSLNSDPGSASQSGSESLQNTNDPSSSSSVSSGSESPKFDEIIVTAQKKSERLQDVPVPVTVLNTEALAASNTVRFLDYYQSIPNLTVSPGIQSQTSLSIRGISQGSTPTVGVLVDDVPFGSALGPPGTGQILPDFDPGDLQRIEVLRGPQGALYGASAMGGLVKFVTADPSTDAVSGRVQAGVSSVYNGAELGYNVRGSVNLPLSDSFAVRVSAFHRQDPGYIDDPITHVDGVNEAEANGGHLAALWRPSSEVSLKLSALVQDTHGNGSSEIDIQPGLSDLQQSNVKDSGEYDREIQAYSATLTAKFGKAELTSISGYSINDMHDSFDYSYALGPIANQLFGVSGTPVLNHMDNQKFTQELRLSLPVTDSIDWLLGGYYTHETNTYQQIALATDPLSGARAGTLLNFYDEPQPLYWEAAAFTDVTLHFTDQFQVQLGGRESDINVLGLQSAETGVPALGLSSTPIVSSTSPAKANVFTYLLTPQFKLSSDFMTYLRLASGYRPGGANCPQSGCIATQAGAPITYSPDKTQNYELGVKGDFLNRILDVDASLYYVDWNNIQIQEITAGGGNYQTNAGGAKSQGVELSVESRPLAGLKLSGWVVLNDAQLTKAFPISSGLYAVPGDQLPSSSRFSGNFVIDQDIPLFDRYAAFVGATESYSGEQLGAFQAPQPPGTPQRQEYPAYAKLDLRSGIKYDSWTITFSAINVADRRGVLAGGAGNIPPYAFYYIEPRTVSLAVVKAF
jgi:iron complex outermembrane recepter protein